MNSTIALIAFFQGDMVLVGDAVAKIEGLPSGCVLSNTVASLVLGIREQVWCCNATVLHVDAWLRRGEQWQAAST